MNNEKQIIDLLSQIGKLLLQHGAETDLVERSIKKAASNLEYQDLEILILPNVILLSLPSNGKVYNTKLQKAERQDVNFSALDKVESMVEKINPTTNIAEFINQLKEENSLSPMYPYYLRNIMAGIGCGSFSLLFGGDLYIFISTFIASYLGFYLNGFLLKRYFNPFVVIIVVSFVTTIISGFLTLHNDISHIAISSSILFLVPSVAFINSVNDLTKRHYTTGLIRGLRGVIISSAIAIGISLALNILGVEKFL
ncbi:threonine/serine ThrE exporter family protein [Sulfurimonas microaerophilic]|uniref:threonine/serine ThrE exporter family protein n=1 Tax=Sulfurimonas microaerophilic TaxID=3058392 RepID=UPI0027154543|nr:threonine/serine exporter family protein [Sulfurimonas sp. hsl 1-7]